MVFFKKLATALHYLPTLLQVKRKVYGEIDAESTLYWLESIEKQLMKHPEKDVLLFQDETIQAKELLSTSYQITRWAEANRIMKGDVVALHAHNGPMFVAIIMGLGRIGVRVALINTDIKQQALSHCLHICGATWVISDSDTAKLFGTLSQDDQAQYKVVHTSCRFRQSGDFERAVSSYSEKPIHERPRFDKKDVALYIYTSGTTGMPKAVKMSQTKLTIGIKATSIIMRKKRVGIDDKVYISLPLFHSTGLVVGLFPALNIGAQVIIAQKFSASHFFEECIRYQATVVMYIGEVFRYLMHLPASDMDKSHRIRLAIGNGLRPDVWPVLGKRFGIHQVIEFYAATEGNFIFFNIDQTYGSVGWLPASLFKKNGGRLIRLQDDNITPVRDASGFCVEAEPFQPGELIGRIPKTLASQGSFDGYTSKEETEQKIVRDAFEKDDQYFRTGDILRYDRNGYFYFMDRVGDTFRWKGHNVSTLEVAERLNDSHMVREAMVYGVAIPGYDGKAGMAALVMYASTKKDVESVVYRVVQNAGLASYQMPKFVRIVDEIAKTSTKKYQRTAWADEGIDIKRIKDPVYFYDHEKNAYLRLTQKHYQAIVNLRELIQ